MPVYTEKLNELNKLPRDEYMEEYRSRGKNIWDMASIPTVGSICDAVLHDEVDPSMQYMFNFFDNEEKFMSQAGRINSNYSEDESEEYIASVISSNVSDIADAGYMYKQMMASQDDMRIVDDDCRSKGKTVHLYGYCPDLGTEECANPDEEGNCTHCKDLGKLIRGHRMSKKDTILPEVDYAFYVRGHWVMEYDGLMLMQYDDFVKWVTKNKLDELHVRTPATCKHASKRRFCEKCCGHIPDDTKNIGAFATLCITEFATQAALSSMNKGSSDNINKVLASKFDLAAKPKWNDILQWVDMITTQLKGDLVSCRFYEISLLSRAHEVEPGTWRVFSLKTSINHTKNRMGAWLFQHNRTNFKKMVQEGSMDDDSLKMQIALNQYDR